mgnify:CR=1 FL=1
MYNLQEQAREEHETNPEYVALIVSNKTRDASDRVSLAEKVRGHYKERFSQRVAIEPWVEDNFSVKPKTHSLPCRKWRNYFLKRLSLGR